MDSARDTPIYGGKRGRHGDEGEVDYRGNALISNRCTHGRGRRCIVTEFHRGRLRVTPRRRSSRYLFHGAVFLQTLSGLVSQSSPAQAAEVRSLALACLLMVRNLELLRLEWSLLCLKTPIASHFPSLCRRCVFVRGPEPTRPALGPLLVVRFRFLHSGRSETGLRNQVLRAGVW